MLIIVFSLQTFHHIEELLLPNVFKEYQFDSKRVHIYKKCLEISHEL